MTKSKEIASVINNEHKHLKVNFKEEQEEIIVKKSLRDKFKEIKKIAERYSKSPIHRSTSSFNKDKLIKDPNTTLRNSQSKDSCSLDLKKSRSKSNNEFSILLKKVSNKISKLSIRESLFDYDKDDEYEDEEEEQGNPGNRNIYSYTTIKEIKIDRFLNKELGTKLKWKAGKVLAEGGASVVYEALNLLDGTSIAVKRFVDIEENSKTLANFEVKYFLIIE